ncbi:hypothetical protein ACFV27_03265 [Streptomyces antimycoticus]|uniref:hypothetical protein n=1 Tax=Streptomyces antimycoticus TaxID=68175 RepID=UPI00256FC23C|nr:hypothetical protein [Streptomyces antimycoticus]WJD96434.1 hypothetical protein QR300_10815 [Streptomyces antimycoticus]
MGELLALASALCFGTTHFLSGLVSRRRHGVAVAAWAQTAGTVVSLIPVLLNQGATAPAPALAWGALSGLGTGVGGVPLLVDEQGADAARDRRLAAEDRRPGENPWPGGRRVRHDDRRRFPSHERTPSSS